jgi:hypothetical protein
MARSRNYPMCKNAKRSRRRATQESNSRPRRSFHSPAPFCPNQSCVRTIRRMVLTQPRPLPNNRTASTRALGGAERETAPTSPAEITLSPCANLDNESRLVSGGHLWCPVFDGALKAPDTATLKWQTKEAFGINWRQRLIPLAARTCNRRHELCGWRRGAPDQARSCGAGE